MERGEKTMSVQTIKQSIHEMIDKINNEDLLQAYLKIIEVGFEKEEGIVGYTTKGTPLTKEELVKKAKGASARVKSGDYISQEDLENQSESW